MAGKSMDKDPMDLDALFAAEREQAPDLSTRLMENILADAAEVAAERKPALTAPARPGWIRRVLEPFGGTPALAGAMAAVVVGVYVGYSGFESLPVVGDYVASLSSDTLSEFGLGLDSFNTLLEEG